ncbi:SAM-dependent methyltransferase [Nocardia sp. NPDC004711]
MSGTDYPELRFDRPSSARVYDFLFGGKDNYQADRALAELLLEQCPSLRVTLGQGRRFVRDAVARLAGAGVRQFVDLGTGIPRQPYLHTEVFDRAPEARVVYADCDLMVAAHAHALMVVPPAVGFVQVDITDAEDLMRPDKLAGALDLSLPAVAVLESVVEFWPAAHEVVAGLARLLVPGSYVVISHLGSDISPRIEHLRRVFGGGGIDLYPRSRDELAELLCGFELCGLGVAPVVEWLVGEAGVEGAVPHASTRVACYGAIARL